MKKDRDSIKFFVTDTMKASLIALLVSLVLVLILAFAVKVAGLGEDIITPVIYAVKLISIAAGAILGISRKKDGALKGAVAGALYILAAFFIFAMLAGAEHARFNFIDMGGGIVAGAISGIIAVNLKREVAAAPRRKRRKISER
jgi:putative membrane protein (TIGR04086 family)